MQIISSIFYEYREKTNSCLQISTIFCIFAGSKKTTMQQDMPEHTLLGRNGEDYAVQILKKKGYSIEDRNWRIGHFEVDIIASNRNEIVFVEVKTRSTTFGQINPAEYVDEDKKFRIVVACKAYMKKNHITKTPRFDIIGILMNKETFEVVAAEHYENIFSPVMHTISTNSFSGCWKRKRR